MSSGSGEAVSLTQRTFDLTLRYTPVAWPSFGLRLYVSRTDTHCSCVVRPTSRCSHCVHYRRRMSQKHSCLCRYTPAGPHDMLHSQYNTVQYNTTQCLAYFAQNAARRSVTNKNKKLSYRRGTARCVVSIKILPIAKQQCRNYLCDKS